MVDNPHDALFKTVFSQPEHAAGELRTVLPPELSERIAWETLEVQPGSFIDDAFAQSHADLLFGAALDGRQALIYCLFEHLSTAGTHVPLRLLRYKVRIWDRWLEKHPTAKKLPPIVAIVIHHSEAGWHGTTQMEETLDTDDQTAPLLSPFVPKFRFLLDDVSHATDADLRQRAMTALGRVALWCLRDVRKPGVLLRNLWRWLDLLGEVRKAPNGLAAMRAILRYVVVTTKRVSEEEIKETLQRLAASEEDKMDTVADQLEEMFREKGIAIGIERGVERGLKQGQRRVLLRLLGRRFGEVPASIVERVNGADEDTLDTWADRVLTAKTLDDVFASS